MLIHHTGDSPFTGHGVAVANERPAASHRNNSDVSTSDSSFTTHATVRVSRGSAISTGGAAARPGGMLA